ncbi:ribonuclease [Pseudonocardiaceae bacterium YIM PH 21723]|nr:ribonuclease [Pseudonocardiaceae bacterium YIM PH 21723]
MVSAMKQIATRIVASLVLFAGVGLVSPAISSAAPVSTLAQPACGDTSSYTKQNLSSLPSQATDTVNLIKKGGPYPYKQDGTVFGNKEKVLPNCQSGYYHEYTVKTPGSSTRGARRIVTGDGTRLYFYTDDHYESFSLVNVNG